MPRHSLFQRITSGVLVFTVFLTSLIIPTSATAGTSVWIADSSGVQSNWATHAAISRNWVSMPNYVGYGQEVLWPRDNWTAIAEADWVRRDDQVGFDWRMIDGERWITYGRVDAARAGVPSNEISDSIAPMPKNAAYVFAAYSPESAELIIEMQKVERLPNGKMGAYRADFTPWHGEISKWRRDYLSDNERAIPALYPVGFNPFENFKGTDKTDPVFHNISWEAASVAIGLAMVHADAHFSFIAADESRFTQKVKKSGGLLKKKVTVYIDGWVKPKWFVGSFIEAQPDGGIASICVKNIGAATANGNTTTCDDPGHMASSMISIKEWKGGNMPQIEEKAYSYKHSKSGFTVIAFTILTFAVTWGAMSAMSMAWGAAGGAGFGGVSSLTGASIAAGVYAGVNVLSGASLTDAQAGWMGATGNGVVNPDLNGMNDHQRRLTQGIRNKQINSRVGTGLAGVRQLYKGDCTDETMTKQQCVDAGLDPGQMHRADSFHDVNIVIQMREREAQCKEENPDITPQILQKCAASLTDAFGVNKPWTVDTGM